MTQSPDIDDRVRPSLLRRLTGCPLRGLRSLAADIEEVLLPAMGEPWPAGDGQPRGANEAAALALARRDGPALAELMRQRLASREPRLQDVAVEKVQGEARRLWIRLSARLVGPESPASRVLILFEVAPDATTSLQVTEP